MQESNNLYMKRIKLNLKKVDTTGFLISSLASRNVLHQTKYSKKNFIIGRHSTSAHLSRNESIEIDVEHKDDNNESKPFVYEWKDPEGSLSLQNNQEARDKFFGNIKYEEPLRIVSTTSRLSAMFEENKNNKNRFFKYAKFDGLNVKQRNLTQAVNIHMHQSLDIENQIKLSASIQKSASIKEAVGFFLYLIEEKYPFALKDLDLELYELRIADDEGVQDEDFPALEFDRTIKDYFIEDLLLIFLKHQSKTEEPKEVQNKTFDIFKTFDENAKLVTINSDLGLSAIHVAHQYVTIHEIVKTYLKKRSKESILSTSFYVEHVKNIGVPLNLDTTISEYEPLQFNIAFHEGCYEEQNSELSEEPTHYANHNKNSFSGMLIKSYAGSREVKLFLQGDMIVIASKPTQLKSVSLGKLPKKKLLHMRDITSSECRLGKSRNEPSSVLLKYVCKERVRKLQIQLNVNDAEILINRIKSQFKPK